MNVWLNKYMDYEHFGVCRYTLYYRLCNGRAREAGSEVSSCFKVCGGSTLLYWIVGFSTSVEIQSAGFLKCICLSEDALSTRKVKF